MTWRRRCGVVLILVALLLVLLAACSDDNPHHVTSGKVTSKHHDGGYYYTVYNCFSYNSQGLCTVRIPSQVYQPDDWSIVIRNCDMPGTSSQHPCLDGRIHLDEQTYNDYKVGAQYP